MADLPEPTTWLARAVTGTLRKWIADSGHRGGTFLGTADVDCLDKWIDELAAGHRETAAVLERSAAAERGPAPLISNVG